jgi:hypothetical protein
MAGSLARFPNPRPGGPTAAGIRGNFGATLAGRAVYPTSGGFDPLRMLNEVFRSPMGLSIVGHCCLARFDEEVFRHAHVFLVLDRGDVIHAVFIDGHASGEPVPFAGF